MSKVVISLIIGYLIGSIPFCVLTAKMYKINLSKIGSGNLGGTNLSRALGWKIAIYPSILDGVKAWIAAMIIAYGLKWEPKLVLFAATAAAFGHVFPWWNKFSGGKGVAAMIGFSYVVLPFYLAFVISMSMVLIVKKIKIMTYASMFVITSILISTFYFTKSAFYNFGNEKTWPFALTIWLLVVIKHRENIYRLLRGKERKC